MTEEPEDIATLYSQAHMEGTRYWGFSASRMQVRGQFRLGIVREPLEWRGPARPVPLRPGEQFQEVQVHEPRVQEPHIRDFQFAEPHVQEVAPPEPQVLKVPVEEQQVQEVAPPEPLVQEVSVQEPQVQDFPFERPQVQTCQVEVPQSQPQTGISSASALVSTSDSTAPVETPPPTSPGGPTRWYALRSVFTSADTPAGLFPLPGFDQRPPIVMFFSLAGGVGKTCLAATLGRALSALGEHVLLADTAVCGVLPFYFGSPELRPGVVRTFSPPGPPPAVECDTPVQMLNLQAERLPGDGGEHDPMLGELLHHARGASRILVDVATASREVTRRLLRLRPTVIVPVLPDMSSVACLRSLEALLASPASEAGPDSQTEKTLYLLNQFDASSPLHLDVRSILQQQLGDRLLPFVLRRSPAVSEALAEGMTVIDYAPGSEVAEDYRNLAAWLRSFIAPAVVGSGLRWSER
jgi:cellulose synthase operon protein YhjQ